MLDLEIDIKNFLINVVNLVRIFNNYWNKIKKYSENHNLQEKTNLKVMKTTLVVFIKNLRKSIKIVSTYWEFLISKYLNEIT